MNRKTTIGIVVALILVTAVSSASTYYLTLPPPPKKLDKVILSLSWVTMGYDCPYYVAIDKGFYEENGISCTVIPGAGSVDTTKRLDMGTATFAAVSMGAIIMGDAQGMHIKSVGLVDNKNPLVIHTLKSRDITQPKQLEGLTVAGTPGAENTVLFPAFCKYYGVDINKIHFVNMIVPVQYPSLVAKKVDALTGMVRGNADVRAVAKQAGDDINLIWWNFSYYGYTHATTDKLIQQNPDLVKRFVDATYKGFDWAMKNPSAAIDIERKYVPEINPNTGLEAWNIVIGLIKPGATGKQIAVFDPTVVQNGINLLTQLGIINKTVSVDDVYTNQFVTS